MLPCLVLSMGSHRHYRTEEIEEKLRAVTDTLYEEFVVPNPFAPNTRVRYNDYATFVEALIESQFDLGATPAVPMLNNVPPQAVLPAPQGPVLHPNWERAVRCSSNSLATGTRCARASFLPYTLCSVHFRYFKVHGFFPPWGGQCTGFSTP